MNIKPGILVTHPWYKELEENGYFIKDKDGKTVTEFYWGGNASFIDFDNPKAVNWWKDQLKEKFLDNGCTGIWNDNNELELEDVEIPSSRVKQLYPLKMSKAAYEVFKEVNPSDRPWNYSRSGYAGIQHMLNLVWRQHKHMDNLKYNQYMSIGFGLSGMPFMAMILVVSREKSLRKSFLYEQVKQQYSKPDLSSILREDKSHRALDVSELQTHNQEPHQGTLPYAPIHLQLCLPEHRHKQTP